LLFLKVWRLCFFLLFYCAAAAAGGGQVTEGWKGGAFHRNAPHVKQVTVQGKHPGFPLAFQEYSPNFPHKKVGSDPIHTASCSAALRVLHTDYKVGAIIFLYGLFAFKLLYELRVRF
jgi:hypothetical protein